MVLAGCSSSKDDGSKAEAASNMASKDRPTSGNPYAKSVQGVLDGRKIYLKYGCAGCPGSQSAVRRTGGRPLGFQSAGLRR